jgi:type II secretory pathway component GspD/PulD (secretin)
MKKQQIIAIILLATFTTTWLAAAPDDTAADPSSNNAPAAAAPATDASTSNAPPATDAASNAPPDAGNSDQPATPADSGPAPTNGLMLNFHNAPLSAVLNYLSAKAGLIIESDVNLTGKVNVVSRQPITTNDIVDVLNDQLGKNNYAAILVGRRLTIMGTLEAKTYAGTQIKVATNGFEGIPMDDEIVTEILPLHTLQAQQLVKDLEPLIPRSAEVTANEAGNSIVMTAPQKDIRRIDHIINALDGSALSEVVVTTLSYADSKSVATELKEIFQTEDSNITRASTRNNFAGRGGGGGGRGGGGNFAAAMGFGGGGGGGGGGGEEASKNVDTHAVFVSDDQLNAVISSAPPDYMRMITNVIADLDKPSQDITVMRVFHLKHADPGEIADELTSMFPTTTSSDQNNRSMGFRFNPFGMGQQSAASSESPRMKRETTVMVVPDRRTQSVIVSASKDMMEQIDGVVKDLDKGDQGVQIVTVIDFGGADPATVQETLAGLFSSATSKNQSSTLTATPLANRYTGNANSQSTTTQSTTGSSSGIGGGTTGIR